MIKSLRNSESLAKSDSSADIQNLKNIHRKRDNDDNGNFLTRFVGFLLFCFTFVSFVFSLYAMVFSKFMPLTGNKVLFVSLLPGG